MHPSSWNHMKALLQARCDAGAPLRFCDVGSMSVNLAFPHTYREHMAPLWRYTGCDIAPGRNVDAVMPGPFTLPFAPESFDVVISGQCLEHVTMPWKLVAEMARVLKPSGLCLLTAPWRWELHRCPLDCWRILPDGMRVLIVEAGMEVLEAYTAENDCWGIARKPQ